LKTIGLIGGMSWESTLFDTTGIHARGAAAWALTSD
jgi:aspartate/glutamate racemase